MKNKERPSAIKSARRRLGLTQFDLATRVGCSESMITKIETGRVDPAGWLKEAIAQELAIRTWEVVVHPPRLRHLTSTGEAYCVSHERIDGSIPHGRAFDKTGAGSAAEANSPNSGELAASRSSALSENREDSVVQLGRRPHAPQGELSRLSPHLVELVSSDSMSQSPLDGQPQNVIRKSEIPSDERH